MEKKPFKKPGGWYWKKRRELMRHGGIDINTKTRTISAPVNRITINLVNYAHKYNFTIQYCIE